MAETRRVFSKEFKQKAVELSNVRGNTQEIARELGVSPELIYRWRAEFRSSPNLAFSGNGNKQQRHNAKHVGIAKAAAFKDAKSSQASGYCEQRKPAPRQTGKRYPQKHRCT